jgi:uncharacterized protein YbjT (DUF2867 family)
MKKALIAGATGLIGHQLLQLLLNDSDYTMVKAITRKPLNIHHEKLENVVVDFDNLTLFSEQVKADDVFCCLGTTIKVARSKEAFKKVDLEYPANLAQITHQQGATQFLLVSALGAHKHSKIFYNQVKGLVEEAVQQYAFRTVHIVRPSLLLGPRTEARSGEDAAKVFFKFFGFLVPLKYQAIESATVAKAMLFYARQNQAGMYIHESKDMQKIG